MFFGLKLNHKGSGTGLKITSGTGEINAKNALCGFLCQASISQGQNDRKMREKSDSFAVYFEQMQMAKHLSFSQA